MSLTADQIKAANDAGSRSKNRPVREWGGVLEHPWGSLMAVPRPMGINGLAPRVPHEFTAPRGGKRL